MAVTGTKTVSEMVKLALRKAKVLDVAEEAEADDAEQARAELEMMLKHWQNMGYNLWTKTSGSKTLTTAASYTLSPIRPMRILSARYKGTDGIEVPMWEMTRDEYDELPQKTTTGIPTQFYYDRQREAALLYVWPVLSSATTESVEYTYDRELEDIGALSDTLDVPGEWWHAVMLNLASNLADTYGVPDQMLAVKALTALQDAGAFDREGTVQFMGREW